MTFDEAFKAACDLVSRGYVPPDTNLVDLAEKIMQARNKRNTPDNK